jgi:hypothetical protein
MTSWLSAIYASVALWFAVAIGNVALFTLQPPDHWPVLETIEALQSASMIPIALILHRINYSSRLSAVITVIGLVGMVLGVVIDIAFVSELLSYGKGLAAVLGFTIAIILSLLWLFAANLLAWRGRTLPKNVALLGMAAAITGTLLYPIWAIRLAGVIRASDPQRTRSH